MKVKIIRTTVADRRLVRAGAIEDVSDADAKTLILLGKAAAVGYDEPAQAPEQAPAEELNTENAADVIEESKPRRGKKRLSL